MEKASKSRRDVRGGIRLKRAYDPPEPSDGSRILVDRLWPRGLRKDETRIDLWLREIAPSAELRRWFGHDPGRWAEFRRRYREELSGKADTLRVVREALRRGPVTLLFAARDVEHNNAVALKELLEEE